MHPEATGRFVLRPRPFRSETLIPLRPLPVPKLRGATGNSATAMSAAPAPHTPRHPRLLGGYLLLCCALVFCMVVLGGVTRLSHSGLSMVEWRPLLGAIPPLDAEEWQRVFEQYRRFPEYRVRPVDLAGFKSIFLIEYAHRLLGRVTGLVFVLPFLYFLVRGWLGRRLALHLAALLALGGAQGVLGWYMVQSGLAEVPAVSPLRLAAHLLVALLLYAWLLWLALDLGRGGARRRWNGCAVYAALLVAWVLAASLSGALTAGTRAGFVYNTFPLMDGRLVPSALLALEPAWRNLTENVVTIQFLHRLMALATVALAAGFTWLGRRRGMGRAALWPLAAALVQSALGIATLLHQVPLPLAATHQGAALVLLGTALYCLHRSRRGHPGNNAAV